MLAAGPGGQQAPWHVPPTASGCTTKSSQRRTAPTACPLPPTGLDVLVHQLAVKLAQDVEDGDLRDDHLLQCILEQGRGRQVQACRRGKAGRRGHRGDRSSERHPSAEKRAAGRPWVRPNQRATTAHPA